MQYDFHPMLSISVQKILMVVNPVNVNQFAGSNVRITTVPAATKTRGQVKLLSFFGYMASAMIQISSWNCNRQNSLLEFKTSAP